MRARLAALGGALAASLSIACGPTAPLAAPGEVLCRDVDAGFETRLRGDAALAACVRAPAMQSEGHRREAWIGPGVFDFGDGARLELGSGWSIRGAGPDATRLVASRATVDVFRDGIHSALFVRGAGVTLAGFTFDGFCHTGPSPGPGCEPSHQNTLLAIVVACGFGAERPPDCDVNGLVVEDVRVVGAKVPFLATSTPPDAARGAPGLYANFRDLRWTIRRFQVSGRDKSFRYARVFELGNGATASLSQGPGAGVEAPRRYVVDIEDTDLDVAIGKWGGQLAGVLTIAVNDDQVDLRVNLRRSRWRAAGRLVGIANGAVDAAGASGGRAAFRAFDSELLAQPTELAHPEAPPGQRCPPFDAALYAADFSRPDGAHATRIDLVRTPVAAEPSIAGCPPAAAIDLGAPALAAHVTLCTEDSPLTPGVRGDATRAAPPCAPEEERR